MHASISRMMRLYDRIRLLSVDDIIIEEKTDRICIVREKLRGNDGNVQKGMFIVFTYKPGKNESLSMWWEFIKKRLLKKLNVWE